MKKMRIALIMQGSYGWLGGIEYIKNIILALGSLPPDIRSTFELCLICSKSIKQTALDQIDSYLDKIYYQEIDLEPPTLKNRLHWKIIKALSKQQDPRFEDFIRKENIDFIYPYISHDTRHKSYRSAAWIPDIQY